jgi:hypothetical protein
MALPAALQPNGAIATDFGIEVRITPANPPSFSIELQRAPDNGSGAPNVGAATTIIILPPMRAGGASYVDPLPPDDAFRHYRWRHVADGYDPSVNWTAWARGKPALLPPQLAQGGLVSIYPIMRALALTDGKYALKASDTVGKETDDDLFIAAAKTVKVGTVATPSALTKTIRIPHAELLPFHDTDAWVCSVLDVEPRTANVLLELTGSIVLPKGVTITSLSARSYRQTVSDAAGCALYRNSSDAPTQIAIVGHSSTGWQTQTTSLSQLVGDEAYALYVNLRGVAVAADARFQYAELTYTMPDYSKGY